MLQSLPTSSYPPSLVLKAKAEIERRKRSQAAAGVGGVSGPTLAQFVERTSFVTLDPWQLDLCTRLERLKTERGLRIAIHAPPQHGKSLIVSQRLPAWLLTNDHLHRVKLACYNVTHAIHFAKIVRDLMQSDEFISLCPDVALRLPSVTPAEQWSTMARLKLREAQPSFKALGLSTGFVGQGADTLIIDDPYAEPDEAYSPIVNESVWRFWDETARPRMTEHSNVVVMFHRYTENDLAGRLLAEGKWELWRYAAIADGEYEHPVTKQTWPDPLGRADGKKLSPRFSDEFYAGQQSNGYVWLSQFQGRPTAKEGSFFKVAKLEIIPAAPVGLRCCRGWDLAASKGKGDWTAGVKLGVDAAGMWYVMDVVRERLSTDERNAQMTQTAALDGRGCRIRLAQDPGQAGVDQAQALVRMLAGYSITVERVSGSKEARADAFSGQVNVGNVKLVAGAWNQAFIEELRQFPFGAHDDQTDAVSDSFQELSTQVKSVVTTWRR